MIFFQRCGEVGKKIGNRMCRKEGKEMIFMRANENRTITEDFETDTECEEGE